VSTIASAARVTPAEAAPPGRAYRFSVAQYQRMAEIGILTENDRVELLEGWIVEKMVHNPPHDVSVWKVQTVLLRRLPPEWVVRTQSAITLSDSAPEPDVAVARGPGERYSRAHPQPRDLALVVEVADSTLSEDREHKARIYARARLAVYWIVNIPEGQVEVYTLPRAGKAPAYRQRQDFGRAGAVPLVIEGHDLGSVPVADLLPPPE
jgi:hypothetical protein